MLVTSCTSTKYSSVHLSDEVGYNDEIRNRYAVEQEWWKDYNNKELNRLVDTALVNNPDYIKAAININKELYNLNLATSDLFPTFYSNLGASSQREIYRSDNFSSNFSGELGLNYELDLYGKIRDERKMQELEYEATIMDKETARLSLINSVVDLYFNLEYLKNSIDITRDNVESYQDIKSIIEDKYNSGKVDNLELIQAKQSLLSEKNRLLELETQFKEMEQSLRNILNVGPDEEFEVQYSDILKQKTLGVNIDVPLSVLANRPDLIASQYRLEKSFKNLKAMEKEWYPTLSLRGAIASSSDKARTTFDFPYILGSASVNLPFLDWNTVKNNVKISEADYQISLVEFKDTLNQALNEVAYYYYAYSKSTEIFDNVEENYDNVLKITQYYENRYDSGKSEFKDFLEAKNSENSSRKELLQQKYQIIKYENFIYKAMAGKYS
jgi:NodT family efflux transporter outer membrane factor (OMF) lipoprotein